MYCLLLSGAKSCVMCSVLILCLISNDGNHETSILTLVMHRS